MDRSPDGVWSLNSQGRIVYGSCKDDIILQKKYLLYDAIQKKDKDLESLFRDELRLLEKNLQDEEEHIFTFSDDLKLCYRSGEWMILSVYKPPVNFSDDDIKEGSGDDKIKISFNLFSSKKDTSQQPNDTQNQQQQQQQPSQQTSSGWSFMSSLKFGKKASEEAPPEKPPKPESLAKKADESKAPAAVSTPEQASTPVVAAVRAQESAQPKAANARPEPAPVREEKKKTGGWGLLSKKITDMKETITSTLPKSMDEFLSSEEVAPQPSGGEKSAAPINASREAKVVNETRDNHNNLIDDINDREPEEFKMLRNNVELAEREFKKKIREPGNDKINRNIGIIVRAKVCFSIIDIIGKHFKATGRFALSSYHIWDWIESYSNIVSSGDSFDPIKTSISSLNSSPFRGDKNRKLRTFFCHALK